LPFDDGKALRAYAAACVLAEVDKPKLPRTASILAPGSDPFTEILHRRFTDRLKHALEGLGFSVRLEPVGGERTASEAPAFAFVLAHGSDPPRFGTPVDVDSKVIARACRAGGWIVHLGCYGAGVSAGRRFGDLPERLGIDDAAPARFDAVSGFAAGCLAKGARGVLAHVDSTWSSAFEGGVEPIVDFAEWIASGRGALGYACDSLAAASNRAAVSAYQLREMKSERDSGLAWMRHLDLRGFVALGDPSSSSGWK
jgi:hypothetical protein